MVPSREVENLTSGMGWDGMWVAATPPHHTNYTRTTNASVSESKTFSSRIHLHQSIPLSIPIANPQPLPLRLRHCSSPCLALPSCVVFAAAAHLVLPDYPVVGHGRSGPVHDCLQHQHQHRLLENPGIVHQTRWEVGTD